MNSQRLGQVRIIGGDFRGRKLPVLMADGLRPTADRVRETLFNWLQWEIVGARCLDAFAGSGALGLEALSRGAAWVDFIELSPAVAKQLVQNFQTLKVTQTKVWQGDTLQMLTQLGLAYDGIFLDPPFGKGLMQPVVEQIFQQNLVRPDGWLYLEQEKGLDWPRLPEGWQCVREKQTKEVKYGLFKKEGNDSAHP